MPLTRSVREVNQEGSEWDDVQLTVTAHHARDTSHNAPHERMAINLVLSSVVHVRCRLRPFVLLFAGGERRLFRYVGSKNMEHTY